MTHHKVITLLVKFLILIVNITTHHKDTPHLYDITLLWMDDTVSAPYSLGPPFLRTHPTVCVPPSWGHTQQCVSPLLEGTPTVCVPLLFFFFHWTANIIMLMILSFYGGGFKDGLVRVIYWGGGGRLAACNHRSESSLDLKLSRDSAITASCGSPFQSGMVLGTNDICLYCVLQEWMS